MNRGSSSQRSTMFPWDNAGGGAGDSSSIPGGGFRARSGSFKGSDRLSLGTVEVKLGRSKSRGNSILSGQFEGSQGLGSLQMDGDMGGFGGDDFQLDGM